MSDVGVTDYGTCEIEISGIGYRLKIETNQYKCAYRITKPNKGYQNQKKNKITPLAVTTPTSQSVSQSS